MPKANISRRRSERNISSLLLLTRKKNIYLYEEIETLKPVLKGSIERCGTEWGRFYPSLFANS